MKSFNVSRRLVGLLAAFGLVTGLSVFALGYLLHRSVADSAQTSRQATEQFAQSYELLDKLGGIHNKVQAFLRLKDPDAMEAVLQDIEKRKKEIEELLAKDGATAGSLQQKHQELEESYQTAINNVLQGKVADAYEQFFSVVGKRYDALLKELHDRNDTVGTSVADLLQTHEAHARRAMLWQFAIVGVVLSGLLAFGWRLKNRIVSHLEEVAGTVTESSAQLAGAVGHLSASSQSLASGASEQAASLEETSASLEEIASMTQRNAQNAASAASLASETRSAADTGASDMREMSEAMANIQESSASIANILKTIDEIAFQTNLLALNAAVEAARAGEAGMGFAVVADEVRSLAQRSATAARETAEKIEAAVSRSDRGVSLCGKVAAGLEQIVERARNMDELVAEIAAASKEQHQGVSQLNGAVSQMDKVTQANAATAEESAASAEELNAQAEMLHAAARQLQSLVGGDAAQAGSALPMPDRHNGAWQESPRSTRQGKDFALPRKSGQHPVTEAELQHTS